MKNRILLLAIVASLFMMTSCEKEVVTELTENNPVTLEEKAKEAYAKYVEKHGEVKIEYTTLEELNEVYVENGLKPVTLEGLGITEEAYQLAQERIHDPELAQNRCNAWYWVLIDMSGNGSATAYDLVLAQRVILLIDPPSPASSNFGTISYWWDNSNPYISAYDKTIATQMILGIIPPC